MILLAGREPRSREGLTVQELVNRFLASSEVKVKNGELKQRTWDDYDTVCSKIIQVLGRGWLVIDLSYNKPKDKDASFSCQARFTLFSEFFLSATKTL